MALSIEDILAPRQTYAVTVTKRQIHSTQDDPVEESTSGAAPKKRRRVAIPSPNHRGASTASPESQNTPSPPSWTTAAASDTAAPGNNTPTLPRTFRDFSHFYYSMSPRLRHKILDQIDECSLNELMRGNHWLQQNFDPSKAPIPFKTAFLMWVERHLICKGQSDDGQERKQAVVLEEYQTVDLACYRCFTPRSYMAFDSNPPDYAERLDGSVYKCKVGDTIRTPDFALRRFCIDCGVKDGFYREKDLITSMTRGKWWVCRCQQYHWYNVPCGECRCIGPFTQPERTDE
ncbi:hypothetical protein EsH8_VII_000289 [Colletotrichum jinshuiense]